MSRPKGTGCLYKRPDSSVWWIKYSRNGRTFRESTHTNDERKAGRILKHRLAEIVTGTFVGPHVERVRTDELAEDFIREYRINDRKSLDDAEARWKLHLKPFFGGIRAVDVSSGLIARYVDTRQQNGAANGTINRELAALRRMFRLGQQATPAKVLRTPAFPKLKENNARSGFVTDSQRSDLARECAGVGLWLRTMYEVGSTYGWRVNEVKTLRARNIDLGACAIRLDPGTTKNGEGRVVKFERDSALYELLAACVHGKGADEFVFTRNNGRPIRDFRGTWAKVCCAAGLGRMECKTCGRIVGTGCKCEKRMRKTRYVGLMFHDLRRTAARDLRRAGVAENLIMQIGGWRTRSVFDRYAIVTEDDLADAVRKLEADRRARDLAAAEQISHETVTKSARVPVLDPKSNLLN